MKVKTVRASGLPINNIDKFNEEYRALYDKVIAKVGLSTDKIPTEQEANRATKLLYRVERILSSRYPSEVEWDFVKSKKKWSKLVSEYGPIMIANDKDNKDISYVIMDINF